MIFEIFVIGVGVIDSEMNAATFPAGKGGLGDKQANDEHILKLPALRVIELLIHNVSLPEAYLFDGLFEVVCFSGDADVSPHKGAQRVSHVGAIESRAVRVGDVIFNFRVHDLGRIAFDIFRSGFAGDFAHDEAFE